LFINEDNLQVGNKAIAAILLLYYHLLKEGGFTNDQTVYLSDMDFDGFTFINTRVLLNCESGIDELLINEGAAIYLICDLNDQIIDYEDNFLEQPFTQRIIAFHKANSQYFNSECSEIIQYVLSDKFNYEVYKFQLANIYKKYVVDKLQTLCQQSHS
jgi:hypothetical protein